MTCEKKCCGKKIGIFGGTFNPIHIGHIRSSLIFYDTAELDLLLVIPDRIPPHKSGVFASAEDRLEMVRLAYSDKELCGDRCIEVSNMELLREGKSYTIHTLEAICEKYPGAELFLYVGSDMFYTLEKWYRGSEILGMCNIVAIAREKDEQEGLCRFAKDYLEKYGTRCLIPTSEPLVISSTEIREGIKALEGKKLSEFTKKHLTSCVAEYIMKKGLYL